MGVFGTGLYSGDFAMDLKSAIRAVSRLPYDADTLSRIVLETERHAAEHRENEDHTTFWLVLADQFQKRGLDSESVRKKALEIIDQGTDLAVFTSLGAKSGDVAKRKKVLEELRDRLSQPPAEKSRKTLKSPQPFVMDVGDILIYPTWNGDSINPYIANQGKYKETQQDGWGVIVIIDRGRAFDYLTWYRPLTIVHSFAERPTTATILGNRLWRQSLPGTCSASHFKRLRFEKIGSLPIDETKLRSEVTDLRPGTSAAINDISIANQLETAPRFNPRFLANPGEPPKGRYLALHGIDRILR